MSAPAIILDHAEAHFSNRDYDAGANLVWKAATKAVAMAARSHGYPHNTVSDLYNTARCFDQIYPGHDFHLLLSLASCYPDAAGPNREIPEIRWEHADFTEDLPSIRAMVSQLAQLQENETPTSTMPITALPAAT